MQVQKRMTAHMGPTSPSQVYLHVHRATASEQASWWRLGFSAVWWFLLPHRYQAACSMQQATSSKQRLLQ